MGYLGQSILPFNPLATSGKPRDAQRFNGDNSTTTFTLNYRVDNPTDLEVFVENVQQEPLTAYDAVGSQLIFTEAPPTGTNNIYVVYRNAEPGVYAQIPDGAVTFNKLANNIRLFTTDNFTGDNTTTAFTLSSDVADANTLMVAVDGVFQRAPIHYTASGNTITFTSAPPSSSNVHVRHLGFRTTQSITALPANTTISQPVISSPTITGGTTANTTIVTANLNGQTTVSGNVIPSANTTYDLGSASARWNNIYGNLIGDFSFPSSKVLANTVTSGQQALSSTGGIYNDLNVSLSLSEGTWAVFYGASIENQNVSGSGAPVQGVIHRLVLRDSSNTVIQQSQLMYANYEKTYEWDSATFIKILTVASTTTYKLSHFYIANSGSPTTSTPYARPDNSPTTLIAIKLY